MISRVFQFMRGGEDKRIDGLPVHGWKEQLYPEEVANIYCYVLMSDIERFSLTYGDEPWIVSRIGYSVSNHLRKMTSTKKDITTHFEKRTRPRRMDVICTVNLPPSGPSFMDKELEDIADG